MFLWQKSVVSFRCVTCPETIRKLILKICIRFQIVSFIASTFEWWLPLDHELSTFVHYEMMRHQDWYYIIAVYSRDMTNFLICSYISFQMILDDLCKTPSRKIYSTHDWNKNRTLHTVECMIKGWTLYSLIDFNILSIYIYKSIYINTEKKESRYNITFVYIYISR